MNIYEQLVTELARVASDRAVRSTIRTLQRRTDGLQSGEDSGLRNAWDEICVQVQVEYSVSWGAYEKTAEPIVAREVNRLSPQELSAIWLQTEAGKDWLKDAGIDATAGYCLDDIVDHVLAKLMAVAGDFSNERIRAYVAR